MPAGRRHRSSAAQPAPQQHGAARLTPFSDSIHYMRDNLKKIDEPERCMTDFLDQSHYEENRETRTSTVNNKTNSPRKMSSQYLQS